MDNAIRRGARRRKRRVNRSRYRARTTRPSALQKGSPITVSSRRSLWRCLVPGNVAGICFSSLISFSPLLFRPNTICSPLPNPEKHRKKPILCLLSRNAFESPPNLLSSSPYLRAAHCPRQKRVRSLIAGSQSCCGSPPPWCSTYQKVNAGTRHKLQKEVALSVGIYLNKQTSKLCMTSCINICKPTNLASSVVMLMTFAHSVSFA